MGKEIDNENSVFKHNRFLMSLQAFKSYIATIIYIYIYIYIYIGIFYEELEEYLACNKLINQMLSRFRIK